MTKATEPILLRVDALKRWIRSKRVNRGVIISSIIYLKSTDLAICNVEGLEC